MEVLNFKLGIRNFCYKTVPNSRLQINEELPCPNLEYF